MTCFHMILILSGNPGVRGITNKESDRLVTRVNGEVSKEGIAGSFREHFREVYSGSDTPAHESLKSDFFNKFHTYFDNHANDSISPMYFSWSNMLDILARVKPGKSSSGLIRPEHILHGSLKLPFHLHLLFNSEGEFVYRTGLHRDTVFRN